jgi:DNA-binding NarL/FixJ family response regulator
MIEVSGLKILIVDDDALIRDSLKIILGLEEDIEVVGCVKNGQEAFEFCKNNDVDVILMDIRMPVCDGVLGTKMIKGLNKNIKILILTTFMDDEYVYQALKYGAEGYLLKSQSTDSIIESIRAIFKGNVVFEKEVAKVLTQIKPKKKSYEDYGITEKEFQILKCIGEGLSNKEIAIKLFLSEGTVRNYITSLLDKLNLRDRTQLAIFYIKNFE